MNEHPSNEHRPDAPDLSRRRLLMGGGAVVAGVALTACTSNDEPATAANSSSAAPAATGSAAAPGKQVRIAFSGPVADHGFLAAINSFAKAQAAKYPDVTFTTLEAAADAPSQISAVRTAIADKPDALIIFPQDGDQLTAIGKEASEAGIPVINLDRRFNDQSAYRLFLAGDNYKVGFNAGTYIGEKLKGKADAVIGEITGIQTLTLTQERSQGFADALAIYDLKVTNQVNASFTVQSGQQAMANLLAAAPRLDAVWNQDDDQNVGAEAAAAQANRTEFFIVGNACSNVMLQHIKAGDARIEADVTFTPAISGTAVSLARLIAQGRTSEDLAGLPIPSYMLIDSELVTKDNVDQYNQFGWGLTGAGDGQEPLVRRPITLFTGQWADLPFEEVARLAAGWGYDGLEIACWGDHLDIARAVADDAYLASRREILDRYGLQVFAISNHLTGQAVCDDPIDVRHRDILPAAVWGDGDPEGVRRRAARQMEDTARVAARLGVDTVVGFTGSAAWKYVAMFPPVSQELVDAAYADFADRWNPVLDVFDAEGVRFAHEVHPSEIAYDYYTTERALEAVGHRPAFGLNWDPSHFVWQGLDPVMFLWDFRDRIYHADCKDARLRTGNGRRGVLGSHLPWADPRRGWDFVSTGHGDVPWEDCFRMMNTIGYRGPLSIEWEDAGMDRLVGAPEARAFVAGLAFDPPGAAFDAAFWSS